MLKDIALTVLGFAVSIYSLLMLLRLLLQMARADFYNPISQFIVKATNPVLMPLRKFVPGFFGIDMAAVLLLVAIQSVGALLTHWLSFSSIVPNVIFYIGVGVLESLALLAGFYFFAIIILVVLSWVSPGSYHPVAQLLAQITEPIIRPVRNLLPSAGGLDFSPMIVMLVLVIIRSNILPELERSFFQLFA